MKKRFLCFVVALVCLLMPVLTSCGGSGGYKATSSVKSITITLYGIKGEGTTDEAIQAVQDELNVISEGKLNTRVLLRLYEEDEYYAKLDEAFAAAQQHKDDKKNNKNNGGNKKPAESGDGSGDQQFQISYPEEDGTQVDIFMVRGTEKFTYYQSEGYAVQLNLTDKSSLTNKYVSERFLALTSDGGVPASGGLLDKEKLFGVPNNNIYGEYTYLLVNKAVAADHGYAEANLDTLKELQYFLFDAANDHPDYVTLYNAPDLHTATIGDTLIGTVINKGCHAYVRRFPTNLLEDWDFLDNVKYTNIFDSKNLIERGDYYSLPADKNVAAAFLKGDVTLPAKYEENYYVIPYSMPVMEDLGTVFCVSKYAAESARCLEVINLLQTNVDYRNTFQYGVEDVHYYVDDYTGIIDIVSKDYNMNPADTGNMFLLKENSDMDEKTKALCANNWELAKQQYREMVVSPYFLFKPSFEGLNLEGFKEVSDAAYAKLLAYEINEEQTFEQYAAEIVKEFSATEEYKLFYRNTDVQGGDIEVPETEVPETNAPETGDPGATDAPETEAPEDEPTILCIYDQYVAWLNSKKIPMM